MAQFSDSRYLDVMSDNDLSTLSNNVQVNLFRIVSLSASSNNPTGRTVALCTSPTDATMLGVLNNAPKAGETAEVLGRNAQGTFKVVVSVNSAGVAIGDELTASSDSGAITAVSTNQVFGRALEAGVAGQVITYEPRNHKFGN